MGLHLFPHHLEFRGRRVSRHPGEGHLTPQVPLATAAPTYVAAKTISESHLRKDSLSLNCLNSSVWSASNSVMAYSKTLSCSIRVNGGDKVYRVDGSIACRRRLKTEPSATFRRGQPYNMELYLRVRRACMVDRMSIWEASRVSSACTATPCTRCSPTPFLRATAGTSPPEDLRSVRLHR